MSNVIADFVESGHSSVDPSAVVAKPNEKLGVSSFAH